MKNNGNFCLSVRILSLMMMAQLIMSPLSVLAEKTAMPVEIPMEQVSNNIVDSPIETEPDIIPESIPDLTPVDDSIIENLTEDIIQNETEDMSDSFDPLVELEVSPSLETEITDSPVIEAVEMMQMSTLSVTTDQSLYVPNLNYDPLSNIADLQGRSGHTFGWRRAC